MRSKLGAALAAGAGVVAWAGALGALGGALGNCSIVEAQFAGTAWSERCALVPAGAVVSVLQGDGVTVANVTEASAFRACSLSCAGATTTPLAWAADSGLALAWRVAPSTGGGGQMTVFAAPFGVGAGPPLPAPDPGVDASLGSPFPLLEHVRAALAVALAARAAFSVPGLTFAAARADGPDNADGSHNYTLLISNPTLAQLPLAIASNVGTVRSVIELTGLVPASVYASTGYLPDGFEGSDLGNSTPTTIAGADTRAFRVAVVETGASVRVLPSAAAAPPPPRPRNFALNVRGLEGLGAGSLPALVASFPSLAQAFDLLVVDWRYLASRETAVLVAEAAVLRQVGVGGIVDFDSGLNLFPGLRLFNNSADEFASSMAAVGSVLAKAAAMGWSHGSLALHRTPENNMDDAEAVREMGSTLAALGTSAAGLNVSLHLRLVAKSPVGGVNASVAWLAAAGAAAVHVQPNTAAMLERFEWEPDMVTAVRSAGSGPVLVGASCAGRDWSGTVFADSLPLTGGSCDAATQREVAALLASACGAGACLGAATGGPDVVLIVDAYVGAEADGGPGAGAGAALDLAYAEAAWVLAAADAAA